jgi:hypothetical protein
VDRLVLNAFFPIGHNPDGFRCWWLRLYGSTDQRNNAEIAAALCEWLAACG